MHHIQRHILLNLMRNPSLRYKDLKPHSADPNLFMYHLKQLQREKLVTKLSEGNYTLSPKGKLEADRRQLEDDSLAVYEQPRLVILLAIHDMAKGWLLHTRAVQPVINMTGFLHANVELGHSVTEIARERMKHLMGLDGTFEYRGSATVSMYRDTDLESYVHALMLYCESPKGKLIENTEIGRNGWFQEKDFTQRHVLPSTPVLAELLNKQEFFFTELSFQL